MIQLDPFHYETVRPLFTPLARHLVVDSILSQHTTGRVYADHASQPQTAVIWNQMDTLLFAGRANEQSLNHALRWLLIGNLLPDARSRHVPGFVLYPATPAWDAAFGQIVAGRPLHPLPRRAFKLKKQSAPSNTTLPAGFTLQPLDAAFLAQTSRPHMTAVHGWIDSFWPNLAAFLRKGLGYAVTHDDNVAAWCLSVYAGQNSVGPALEFGVETAVGYRGQGLATAVAAACLQQCRQQGIVPHWQCNRDNRPSLRVATKIGFAPDFDYTAYWLPFANDDERHTDK